LHTGKELDNFYSNQIQQNIDGTNSHGMQSFFSTFTLSAIRQLKSEITVHQSKLSRLLLALKLTYELQGKLQH